MTKKIYYEDLKLYEIEAKILDIRNHKSGTSIILDRTIFYPEGGGQPADTGFIGDFEINNVQKIDNQIYHISKQKFKDEFKKLENKIVLIKINKEKRIYHSTQHTAQHLLSGVLDDKYNAATKSFHLGKDYATIDVLPGTFSKNKINEIELQLLEKIKENLAISTKIFKTKDDINIKLRRETKLKEDIRVLIIENLDNSACGGTHLTRTGEILLIKILKVEKYKSKLRIYYISGKKALCLFQEKSKILDEISNHFSTTEDLIYEKILKNENDFKTVKKNNEILVNSLLEIELEKFKNTNKLFHIFQQDYADTNFLDLFLKKYKNQDILFIASKKDLLAKLKSNDSKFDCAKIINDYRKIKNLKGGGNKKFGQVIFDSSEELNLFYSWIRKFCS